MRHVLLAGTLAALALALAGCGPGTQATAVQGGDPAQGHDLIVHYGCGTCHTIGGVSTADGTVGPALTGFDDKRDIAGLLPNDPQHVISWIMHPQQIEPGTLMPDLGVSEPDARSIAAYLYTQ